MQIDRAGIHLGVLTLTFFGLMLVAGLVAGGYLSMVAAQRRGEDPDHVIDGLTWAILAGLVGARLVHIFAPPPSMVALGLTTGYYLTHPFDLVSGPLAVWAGGLNGMGALLGGLFGLWLYTRRQRLDAPTWADIAALGLPLGLAVSSVGSVMSGYELDVETTLPWGVTAVTGGPRYHPAPVYLSLWMLVVLAVLWWVERRYAGRLKPGELFLWFVALLGPGLWLFEAFHADKRLLLPGVSGTQVAALLASLSGLLWITVRHRRSEDV